MMRYQRANSAALGANKDGGPTGGDSTPPPANKSRKVGSSNLHKIREFELEQVVLSEEFDILQIVGEGWFGKILLVEHRVTDTEMVLKALPKPYVTLKDFYTEFHYGLHLGSHKNIITTYDVAFETAGFFVFSQEYAPLGDLTSNVSETGIGELHAKRVAKQLAAALSFVHMKDLVHRDVKLDNVLVFKSDFSRVKLCDFGETRKLGSLVRRRNEWLPYSPPDVLERNTDETYKAETSQDIWQFAIVVFVCLTGCLPWQKAAPDDPRYSRYLYWVNSTGVLMPIRQPKLFKALSNKAQRWFRKFLEPRPDKRPNDLAEMYKYVEDRWLARSLTSSSNNDAWTEGDGLCPSMYSFHSSADEKNKLLQTLTQYGIETTVDRGAKKDRIKAWIQSSVIEEDREEDEERTARHSASSRQRHFARDPEEEERTTRHSANSRERQFARDPEEEERTTRHSANSRERHFARDPEEEEMTTRHSANSRERHFARDPEEEERTTRHSANSRERHFARDPEDGDRNSARQGNAANRGAANGRNFRDVGNSEEDRHSANSRHLAREANPEEDERNSARYSANSRERGNAASRGAARDRSSARHPSSSDSRSVSK